MRVYLSGPMSGIENHNFPAFEAATLQLQEAGYEVYSPHENDLDWYDELGDRYKIETELPNGMYQLYQLWNLQMPLKPSGDEKTLYAWYMKRDFMMIAMCDGMVFLPNWENSKGCCLEHQMAVFVGMECMSLEKALENSSGTYMERLREQAGHSKDEII